MTKPTEKVPAQAKKTSLTDLCRDLKISPREARLRLRAAAKDKTKFAELASAHRPRQPWEWEPNSQALAEARSALQSAH